jgi:hypothetical protein
VVAADVAVVFSVTVQEFNAAAGLGEFSRMSGSSSKK